MNISYSGTVTAGELLQVISFLIAVFAVYNRISIEIAALRTDVNTIKHWWENLISNQTVEKVRDGD